MDRATDLEIGKTPRTASLRDGAIVADVAHQDGAPSARIVTPVGSVDVLGTKLAVTATGDRASVEVLRGTVDVRDTSGALASVNAGQEAQLTRGARIDVAPANDLAQRVAFEGELGATLMHNEDADGSVSGLGELRAKKPGRATEKDHAVRLSSHAAKIRIAGNVARTEIDETFVNDTGDVLEGIYRFPLPPGAQIERLALEVDGKLVEGEFVDKAKAAAIWRGAIQNAAPHAPTPREEIIWVPGPWRDPALLEWQRGGRFELKIFPIPKRGARRVVIAYTETVAPVSGVRRYTYPLPQSTASDMKIDTFSLDAQVTGADPATAFACAGTSSRNRRTARPTRPTPSGSRKR